MATNDILNPDYRSISELPSMEGAVPAGDELLILSKELIGQNAGYVSYKVSIKEIEPCLSDDIKDAISAYTAYGYKNLVYADKSDLEYNPGYNKYELTSFAVRALSNNTTFKAARVEAQKAENKLYAISALKWNDNLTLTSTEDIELTQLSAAAYNKVLEDLERYGIKNGVQIITPDDIAGLSLAQIKVNNNQWKTIYSGDPSELVHIQPLAISDTGPINAGQQKVAKIDFGGTNKSVVISNALSVNAVPPSYNPDLGNTGEVIGYINRVALKNNLSIMSDQDTKNIADMAYGQYGNKIARINGKYILNGLKITNVDTTAGSKVIANINGVDIHNGIAVKDRSTVGYKICNIDGKDIYNNINIVDCSGAGNGNTGDRIAQINDVPIYNGVVITDDVSRYQTSINGHKILGGVRLGKAVSKTTDGDEIAQIETSNGTVSIHNGINAQSLSSDIVTRLEAKINALQEQHQRDIAQLWNEFSKYLLLNSNGAMQTVTGPTTFVQTINGSITNANYAAKANWS